MASKRRRVWILYIAALHALVAFMVVKTNFVHLASKTLGVAPPEEVGDDLYRATLDALVEDERAGDVEVLLLGDSLLAPLPADELGPGALNLAVGGTTVPTLSRWLPAIGALAKKPVVVLQLGCNDLKYRDPLVVASDYAGLVTSLRAAGATQVYVLSVMPLDERTPAPAGRSFVTNEEIEQLNGQLASLAAGAEGAEFVDLRPTFRDDEGQLRAKFHAGDGWHLSRAGLDQLASDLRAALRR